MGSPTWVELVGRNVAATAQPLSGTMRATGRHRRDDDLDERFEFWHGGAGRWRIVADGTVLYVSAAADDVVVRLDGGMRRPRRGNFGTVWLGSFMSPLDLLGEDSLLRKMSQGMIVARQPAQVEVDGRRAWSVSLAPPDDDRAVELAFDDATGIIVRVQSPGGGRVEVSGLTAHEVIDPAQFVWDGSVVDERVGEESSDPVDIQAARLSILSALSTALTRAADVVQAVGDAADDEAARSAVMTLLAVDEIGADAVLAMQVRRFSARGRESIALELAEVRESGRE